MNLPESENYVGRTILVGVTYNDHEGRFIEQRQFHGIIERADSIEGIVVKLHDSGEYFYLPPQLDTLEIAPKGEYRLRNTGEVVVDPDFLTTWTTTKAPPD